MSNNDLAGQRRAGAAETSLNNVIYIGRASFRMEPAPLSADDLYDQAGEDNRASGVASAEPFAAEIPFALDVELEEVTDDAAALPAAELEDSESVPALRPVRAGLSGIRLSRSRLVVLGALAFSAGILTSAGARTLVKAPRAGQPAVAAAAAAPILNVTNPSVDPPGAEPSAIVAGNPTPRTTVAENAAAPTEPPSPMPAATRATVPEPKVKAPVAASERPHARGTNRSRPSRRAQARASAPSGDAAETSTPDTAADAPAPRDPATWVDPFAQ